MSLHIVYAGSRLIPPPIAALLEKQIPVFTGFVEEEGNVFLGADVLIDHFGPGKLAPTRLIARAYGETSVAGLTLDELANLAPLRESSLVVTGPSSYHLGFPVGEDGLIPGVEYGFVLLADFPD